MTDTSPAAGPRFAAERTEVARACRVLAAEGLVNDILGHVSLRVGDRLMLVRARGPHDEGLLLTRSDDVVLVHLDGQPAEDLGERQLPQELPIHTETLRLRPEMAAVVHSHPPEVVLCSVAGLSLEPVFGSFNIPAMRLAERGVPTFDYYGLIRDRPRAEQMVKVMDDRQAVILRGHGLTTAGTSLANAVVTALNVNLLAAMTAAIARIGRPVPPVPEQDRAELPDLGSTFNDDLVWRHHKAKLAYAGRDANDHRVGW